MELGTGNSRSFSAKQTKNTMDHDVKSRYVHYETILFFYTIMWSEKKYLC